MTSSSTKYLFVPFFGLLAGALFSHCTKADPCPAQPERFVIQVKQTYPHDRTSYTQGLIVDSSVPLEDDKPVLIESAGKYRMSKVFRYKLGVLKPIVQTMLPPAVFGEGIANVGRELFVLTWQEGRGFVFDMQGLGQTRTWNYTGEGWGLARVQEGNRTLLVQSDGTAELKFLDPVTLKVIRSIWVNRGTQPQPEINELEVIDGLLYANLYGFDEIVGIDLSNGCIVRSVESTLKDPAKTPENVLNGIAYDPRNRATYVTGKRWTQLHRVEFVPANSGTGSAPTHRRAK